MAGDCRKRRAVLRGPSSRCDYNFRVECSVLNGRQSSPRWVCYRHYYHCEWISKCRLEVSFGVLAKLKKASGNKLPSDPAEHNRIWYRFYKSVEDNPAVTQVHRDFLLTRDYAGLAALFLVIFGPAVIAQISSWRVSLTYFLFLL